MYTFVTDISLLFWKIILHLAKMKHAAVHYNPLTLMLRGRTCHDDRRRAARRRSERGLVSVDFGRVSDRLIVVPCLQVWAPTLENMLLRNVLLELNLKDGTRAESM